MDITWRPHCSGLVLGAFRGGTPLAGITGPHPNGRYSATFYGNWPMDRPRELFSRDRERLQAKVERVLAAWERARERRDQP